MGGGIGGLHRITTLIHQTVDIKSVLLACGNHKLPQTASARSRYCLGVQCRLDDGQVLQFQWEVVSVKGFLEDGHIEIRGAQHITDGMAQTTAIAFDEFLYYLVVDHLHHRRHTMQAFDILFLGIHRIDIRHLTVTGHREVGLRHIEVHQTVEIVGHRLRKLDHLLVTLLVSDGDLIVLVYLVVALVGDRLLSQQGAGHHQQGKGERVKIILVHSFLVLEGQTAFQSDV